MSVPKGPQTIFSEPPAHAVMKTADNLFVVERPRSESSKVRIIRTLSQWRYT
jgi:hypothetical protein